MKTNQAPTSYSATKLADREGQWYSVTETGLPVIVLEVNGADDREIKTRHLHVHFRGKCRIDYMGSAHIRSACIIECQSQDRNIQQFFRESLSHLFNAFKSAPSASEVYQLIEDTQDIFSKVGSSSVESLRGVVGELLFIHATLDAVASVNYWHTNGNDLIDFVFPGCQLEIKTTALRERKHRVTFDQLSAGGVRPSYIISMQISEAEVGLSLQDIVISLAERLGDSSRAQKKLFESTAPYIQGENAVAKRFDVASTLASARVFCFNDVPAIRGVLPSGVSNVKFDTVLAEEKGTLLAEAENFAEGAFPKLSDSLDIAKHANPSTA